jgi:transcription elongation factor GreB
LEKNYITPAGFKRLADELTELATVERPRVVREVADAAAEGDRSENAAYIYGKKRLREIDRRMGFLQRRLDSATVVAVDERESQRDRIYFGAQVTVEDEEGETATWHIVGVDEVDAPSGRISWKSPVGRALLGKRIDDTVTVKWHAGERELTVVEIRYGVAAPPPATTTPPPSPSTKASKSPQPRRPTPRRPTPRKRPKAR